MFRPKFDYVLARMYDPANPESYASDSTEMLEEVRNALSPELWRRLEIHLSNIVIDALVTEILYDEKVEEFDAFKSKIF